MLAADRLCAGLPTLLDRASERLSELRPMGLGVLRAGHDNRSLLVYVDSFGSTAYLPRIDELPSVFRPGGSGPAHLNPDDLSSNPPGLIESRLLHIGSAPEYTRPHGLGQIYTCAVA